MKLDSKKLAPAGLILLGLAALYLGFRLYTLNANLSASAGITSQLKSDVERLEAENGVMREETRLRQQEAEKLSQELETLRSRDSAAGKRNGELESLVGEAEKTLGSQNARIAELEARLREAEDRLKRQREKSENLAGAARDAKGAGANGDYAKLMEAEWLGAIAQTEALQKELEDAMLELSDGNSAKARMQREVATMHYNLAVILTNQGEHQAASREYERALAVRPDDPESHYNLAVLYDTELKDQRKALEHYRQYIRFAPEGDDARKVRLWIKEKEFDLRLDHKTVLPKEEKRF